LKKIKVLLGLMIVVLLAMGFVTGCGGSNDDGDSTGTGYVSGTVTDSVTGLAIENAKCSITVADTARAEYYDYTDSDGVFLILDVPEGTRTLVITATGYDQITIENVSVTSGGDTEIPAADTEMDETVTPTTGSVIGTVTDESTGTALAGVSIMLDTMTPVTSGTDGTYTIASVTAGTYTLSAALASYEDYTASVTVTAGATTTKNIALTPKPTAGKGNLSGKVLSGGSALASVTCTISGVTPVTTDAEGKYLFQNLDPGAVIITFTKTDYKEATASATVKADETVAVADTTMETQTEPVVGTTLWVSQRINLPEVGVAQAADVNDDGTVVVFTSPGNVITTWNSPNAIRQIYSWNRGTGAITRLSNNNNVPGSTAGANNHSDNARISGDGAYVIYQSIATDILASGLSSASNGDVYYVKVADQTIVRVSQDSTSANAGGDAASINPDINGDGSVVVFQSLATDIGNIAHTATYSHIYYVVMTGMTPGVRQMIDSHNGVESEAAAGTANPASTNPRVGWDGRYTAFVSLADTAITAAAAPNPGDVNSIFLNDIQDDPAIGWNNEISISGGVHATANCAAPCIDQDGSRVAFTSTTPWASGDALADVFLWKSGYTDLTQVSVPLAGLKAASALPDIDKSGKYVTFETTTNGLVSDAPNVVSMIYAKDVDSGTNVYYLASRGNSATIPNVGCFNGAISGNGNYVVWETTATNCTSDTFTGAVNDVFLRKWQ